MSRRSTPVGAMLSIVPYFRARGGSAPVSEAARDLGMTETELRTMLWQLWMCGLPGYGPGDLIDLSFSAEDLNEADLVEVTFTAGMDRPLRLTWSEAVTLETGLAVFLDHPEVVDQDSLHTLMAQLRSATGSPSSHTGPTSSPSGSPPVSRSDTPDDPAARLRTAVDDGLALRFTYHSATSDSSRTRVVDPGRISVSDGHSYLHAVDRESGQWRSFRTDRMGGVEHAGPRRPVGPEPEFLADSGRMQRAPVHIPASARWFLDQFPFAELCSRDDGSVDAEIEYFSHDWLLRFLLGHADVVISADDHVRAEVADLARRGLKAHDSGGSLPRVR